MKSRWSEKEAQSFVDRYADDPGVNTDIALRVYSSRLIGQDSTLVLHGGGNTSVKTRLPDDTGADVAVLCVKGSGWDLGSIEPAGLPAVHLKSLGQLRARASLTDEEMVNAQRTRLLDAGSPSPSVETLLHAFLPHKFIDHSHADAILSVVDQPNSEEICKEIFGDALAIVPYTMPGFALAKLAAEAYEANPNVEGLLLLKHGLFTFGASAKESYERHIAAVDKAEAYGNSKRAVATVKRRTVETPDYASLAPVLRGLLGAGERRYLLTLRDSEVIRSFVAREDLGVVSQRGTATPDHVIRTKRAPLVIDVAQTAGTAQIGESIQGALERYRNAYAAYVRDESAAKGLDVQQLDPDPRIILVPGLGMIAAGATEKAARVAADLYEHTVDIIETAEAIGRYEVLGTDDLFDMEYWSLEQAKLGKAKPKAFQGQVVYISGAASGIGAACAARFAAEGASLFLTDCDVDALKGTAEELGAQWQVVDVREEGAVHGSVHACVQAFGGLDGALSNAGVAPQGAIGDIASDALKDSFEVNFFSHQYLASAASRVMRAQGTGGFLLFNASKAAFNPGPDFGPYAIPKAAVVALMKQYALEYGRQGIRANAVNADRVRTGILDEEVVAHRAKARGLDQDAYFRANLLKREVQAADVAEAFLNLALAQSTTGCVVTVDGGNIAASPR